MNEPLTIAHNQTDANEQNRRNISSATDDELQTNHETFDDVLEPNLAQEMSDEDLHKPSYSNSLVKGYTENLLNDRSDDMEVIEHITDESPIPSLVNSSFDSTEKNVLPPISHNVAHCKIAYKSLEEIRLNSNIQSSRDVDVSVLDPMSCTTKVVETTKDDRKNCCQPTTIANIHSDRVVLFDDNVTVETDAAHGLRGFFSSNETSPIADIDTMYAEACNRVLIAKESYNYSDNLTCMPRQQQKTDEEHSESLTGSYFSCRDEPSANDYMNSDLSFHTALYNQGSITSNSTPISGINNDDNMSQHLHGFRDFLSCRSGEEPSSHLFDLSSSRVDDQLSEQDSSLRSYYTCRKFNQQGLISILKKGGTDNDCLPGKKINLPLDILIKEGLESSSYVKSTKKCRQSLRNKYFCYAGSFALVIFVIIVGTVLSIKLTSHSINEQATNENGSLANNTSVVTTQAPIVLPTQAPSLSPRIMVTGNVITMHPSRAPSIQPTSSRHRDNIFLRPPKKRMSTVKVKVNNTLV